MLNGVMGELIESYYIIFSCNNMGTSKKYQQYSSVSLRKESPFEKLLSTSLSGRQNYLKQISSFGNNWTIIMMVLGMFVYAGLTVWPELLQLDSSALKNQQLIRYSIKGSLIYCLGWIVVLTIHERFNNDYMQILKADNRQGYKRMILLSLRLGVFYGIACYLPANHYCNRLLAVLLLYIWLSQKYVRTAIHYNFHSITKKKMQFVNNFSMNQGTSLVFIISPLAAVLVPELPWLPGFVTLFPILCRFTQCLIVGTHEQYLNSIKFTLNLIGFGYAVVQMPLESHYWRIAAAIYSFYWDVFRDWKWKIRLYEKKMYRIDLPLFWFAFGFLYDLFGRSIWIIIPLSTQERGIVEMTRRLAWNILRIEREQVFYFQKPVGNKVKDIFSK